MKSWQAILPAIVAVTVMSSPIMAADELKDPTRPYFVDRDPLADSAKDAGADDGSKGMVLSSTFVSGKSSFALINEKLVRKGDRIGSMRVMDIKPMKVLLRSEDTKLEITLLQDSIKTEATKQTSMLNRDSMTGDSHP